MPTARFRSFFLNQLLGIIIIRCILLNLAWLNQRRNFTHHFERFVAHHIRILFYPRYQILNS